MPARPTVRPAPHRPLVVTADPGLLDELLRLAAAAGTEVDVAADPVAARARWATAPHVLIAADQAEPCLRARLPRRPRVVLVGGPGVPWEAAEQLGAEHVAELPLAEPWLVDRLATPHDPGADASVLAVVGGRGGAGASVLAGALAVTAARAGRRTLLVDADPLGGGLDLLLGWEQVDGLRWPALTATRGRVDPPALIRALPNQGDLVLLCFSRDELLPVPAEAMAATLDAARRGRDVVVIDLPRHLDDAAALALQAADRTLLVVPAELRAVAAAARVAATVAPHCADVSVVVRGPAPGRLKAREVSRALGLPLAGTLRPEPAVCQGLERGEAPAADGRGPLADLCRRVLDDLTAGHRGAESAA
ncbi:septum site-determining protein Ssd [Spirilliplanes yamanashiensis]|uniref:Septum formation initiator n=1 Tax=Spirilliplanes yamanashiensis TaxID=42233 RepID=A0A8J4DJX7_9ACTN|nr:septum site-determining protein Ssd [Spirilliplanes yamanashiensis]MDP9815449.1 secretion/DNA translocation related CpaE-like protein [Spirilliplanes yamanashiensis]GIJ03703.1 septum formation initiator [Spirilliplanes yamanashiensis]